MAIKKGMYNINGAERFVLADVDKESLADVLRRIGLTSVKIGCGVGQCGTCTVLLNGEPVRSCRIKFKDVPEHSRIETLEGIGTATNLHPLQKAWIAYGGVQCGFCTPGFIMSAKGLLDKNVNPTRQEVRDWFTKNLNLCRCTGYKPLIDAVMAAAAVLRGEMSMEDLDYKIPEDGRVYGTRYPRPDALYKVLGLADYGHDLDLKMPAGTLHMAVTWSKYAHANILGIDTDEAEAMPGVVRVLTHKDVQGTNNVDNPLTHPLATSPEAVKPVLCDKKVRRIGEAVALVVADTDEHARAAAEKVKVDYEPLPVYTNYLDAVKPDAVSIDGYGPNEVMRWPLFKGEDTREIFKNSEEKELTVVEGSFYANRQPHLYLEPWSLQAYYDEDDNLTINYKSQTLWAGMATLPKAIGCPADKLRIIESPTGASFGASMDFLGAAMIGVAEMAVKRPITWTTTFAESQRFTGKRGAAYMNMKLACDKNGKIVAMEFDNANDHGASAGTAGACEQKMVRFFGYPYNIPNIRGLTRAGLTNEPFDVAYRSYGAPQAFTAGEQMMDMMAEKLGIDPFEFRYQNVAVEGDLTNNSYPFHVYSAKGLYDKLRPYYKESRKWAEQPAEAGWKRGVGISCGGYHVSTPADKAEIDLELLPDGSVMNYNCWEEMGQGAGVGTIIHTHEALRPLGLPMEKIKLYQNDTKYCPATGPASASRSHYMAGNAIIDGANKLMDAMRKPDGTYRTYDEMVAEGIPTKYRGIYSTVGMYKALDPLTGVGQPMCDQNYMLCVARIEVNEKTGKTRVVAMHMAADVGVLGNPLIVEGQAYSGVFHSIGYALSEEYADEVKKHEGPLGAGFPRCNDVPDDFEFIFQETPRENGPHGSGGCSENFQSCGHVAILNGIYDAVGVRIYEPPALAQRVLDGLKAKAEGRDTMPEKYVFGKDFDQVIDEVQEMIRTREDKQEDHVLTKEELEKEIQLGGH